MSLLNKMLIDLDKRQATVGSGQPPSKDIFLSAHSLRSPYASMLLWALVAVATGVGVWAWISNQKPAVQPPQITATISQNANPVPVEPLPATGNLHTAKPAVAAVRKDSAGTTAVSTQHDNTKVAATKHVEITMKNEKAVKDSLGASVRDKSMSKSVAGQAPSFKIVSPEQQSDNLYRQAVSLLQQSRDSEAQHALMRALDAKSANYHALQLLAGLMVDAGRNAAAEALLREGLNMAPGHSGFSMALARLQIGNGAADDAISTMEQGLPAADDDAEYHAFLASLLLNKGRHAEAAQHYITALRSNPSRSNWLIGAGISLQAANKLSDAAEAFRRAIDTGELPLEVAQFADQKLKEIRQQR